MRTVVFLRSGLSASMMVRFRVRARRRMSPAARTLKVRAFPGFGRREDFSAEGWRDRDLSIAFQVLMILLAVAWGLMLPA